MPFYPVKISARFHSLKHAGSIIEPDTAGAEADFTCGVSVRFFLRINRETKIVATAKFQTNGCGYVIAAADLLAEIIQDKKLTDLRGFEYLKNAVSGEFGDICPERLHCLNLCFDALHKALAKYRISQIDEWTGEKALICTCFGIAEETVQKIIRDLSLKTVGDVGEKCSAGKGCGSCQPLIQELIDTFDMSNTVAD